MEFVREALTREEIQRTIEYALSAPVPRALPPDNRGLLLEAIPTYVAFLDTARERVLEMAKTINPQAMVVEERYLGRIEKELRAPTGQDISRELKGTAGKYFQFIGRSLNISHQYIVTFGDRQTNIPLNARITAIPHTELDEEGNPAIDSDWTLAMGESAGIRWQGASAGANLKELCAQLPNREETVPMMRKYLDDVYSADVTQCISREEIRRLSRK